MKATAFSPHDGIYVQHLKTSRKHDMPVQHYHDGYEMYLQLDGKRYLFYDNICYTLERGDIAIFKPFEIHYAESRDVDYYERYVLNFQADVLRAILSDAELHLLLDEKIRSCVVHLSPEDTEDIFGYFQRADLYLKQSGFLAEKLLCSAVLQLIMKAVIHTYDSTATAGERVAPQIITAMNYINKYYKENIDLEKLSSVACMSKYYFCRKFHEATGATALEYLNNIRLTKVHNLLLNTNMTIDEIASQTGFMSAVNLARSFKKVYGMAPREFRRSKRQD
ncbi:MAG: AraC family transcriptional regulator [bacterium]|nr:AraC family transcriptional regulator [bacterium]